jgi:hypothetical protein
MFGTKKKEQNKKVLYKIILFKFDVCDKKKEGTKKNTKEKSETVQKKFLFF